MNPVEPRHLLSVRTPLGRFELARRAFHRAWPLLSRAATLHRLTLTRRTCVVAVVGSFGKSTTLRAVHAALGIARPCTIANRGSSIARALLNIAPFQRDAAIEVGISRPGQMRGYARLVRPGIAVVTSIGSEHNRSLRTLEVTRSEKADMVRALPRSGLAVLNGDDANVLWMRGETSAAVVTFGLGERNDVRATDIAIDWPHGTRFTVHAGGETRALRIRLIGRMQVCAALAAIAVAMHRGRPLARIAAALEALPPTWSRLEPVRLANGAFLLRDEYKSRLETVDSALDALHEIPGRRWVIMGEIEEPVGSQSAIYRRIGERVGGIASYAVFIGGKYHGAFSAGVRAGGLAGENVSHVKDVRQVIELLEDRLAPGDTVLIKGRGSQRLDRIALALIGRAVGCELTFCNAYLRCALCPMLERPVARAARA